MTELPTDRPGAVKNKKMPLSQNRFHITADEVQDQNVANEIPGTIMQKHGGKKLPCVCVMNATSTDGKKVANKIRIVALEEQLCDKHRDVRADNCQQRDSLLLRPSPRKRRRLSAGEAHTSKLSQIDFVVDSKSGEPAQGLLKFSFVWPRLDGTNTRSFCSWTWNCTGQRPTSSPSISTGTSSSLLTRNCFV